MRISSKNKVNISACMWSFCSAQNLQRYAIFEAQQSQECWGKKWLQIRMSASEDNIILKLHIPTVEKCVQNVCCNLFKNDVRGSTTFHMGHNVKTLSSKTDILSSIPRTHIVEDVHWLLHTHTPTWAGTPGHRHIQTTAQKKEQLEASTKKNCHSIWRGC